jgi:hypothetical protein
LDQHIHKNWRPLSDSTKLASSLLNNSKSPPENVDNFLNKRIWQEWNSRFSKCRLCSFRTSNKNATTSTFIKRLAVSNRWKFKSIGCPIIHPITTQDGIYKNKWKNFSPIKNNFLARSTELNQPTPNMAICVDDPIATARETSYKKKTGF